MDFPSTAHDSWTKRLDQQNYHWLSLVLNAHPHLACDSMPRLYPNVPQYPCRRLFATMSLHEWLRRLHTLSINECPSMRGNRATSRFGDLMMWCATHSCLKSRCAGELQHSVCGYIPPSIHNHASEGSLIQLELETLCNHIPISVT